VAVLARVPQRSARHLRRVIRNQHAVVSVLLENPQHAQHVHVAFVNERFFVERHLAAHVAKVDVGQLALPAVSVHRFVNVALGHLGETAETKLQRVARAGFEIKSRSE
jgi:hypothetical protein